MSHLHPLFAPLSARSARYPCRFSCEKRASQRATPLPLPSFPPPSFFFICSYAASRTRPASPLCLAERAFRSLPLPLLMYLPPSPSSFPPPSCRSFLPLTQQAGLTALALHPLFASLSSRSARYPCRSYVRRAQSARALRGALCALAASFLSFAKKRKAQRVATRNARPSTLLKRRA